MLLFIALVMPMPGQVQAAVRALPTPPTVGLLGKEGFRGLILFANVSFHVLCVSLSLTLSLLFRVPPCALAWPTGDRAYVPAYPETPTA